MPLSLIKIVRFFVLAFRVGWRPAAGALAIVVIVIKR
jgi:hypothetical protein